MIAEQFDPLATANLTIRRGLRAHHRRRRERARLEVPMRVLDRMLEELEQMNLSGQKRVPLAFEPRITELVGVLGREAGELPPLRTNISPVKLMDMVFELQDRILEARAGRQRRQPETEVA